MSKYLYPIYKLKTKSYIRWWLYNYLGKFNNYVLSEILTGTSFYLEDSTDRKFKIFDIIGRSVQDGDPTPENPVPIKNTGDNGFVNEKVSNSDGTQEQNILFPLVQGQKLMEGDYLADDGIHHVSREMVFNGTENWQMYNISADMIQFFISISGVKHITNRVTIMSNIAKGILIANRGVRDNNNSVYTSSIGLCFRIDEFTTLNDFKAYLAQQYANGTPVKVQYELAEETTEAFTSEQQTAWEQIKALRTYKPVTHISSEDETPAELKIQYWKEV